MFVTRDRRFSNTEDAEDSEDGELLCDLFVLRVKTCCARQRASFFERSLGKKPHCCIANSSFAARILMAAKKHKRRKGEIGILAYFEPFSTERTSLCGDLPGLNIGCGSAALCLSVVNGPVAGAWLRRPCRDRNGKG